MELTTEPKAGNSGIILKGMLLDDHGKLVPCVFDVRMTLDSSDWVAATNQGMAILNEYQNKEWVINGFSDVSNYNASNSTRYFKVNFLGSIPEAVANDIKLCSFDRLTAAGNQVFNTNVSVKYFKPDGTITICVNGQIYMVQLKLVHEPDKSETCETCQHGEYLIGLAFRQMDKANLTLEIGEGETVADVLADNFQIANVGPFEMARVTKAVFSFVSV